MDNDLNIILDQLHNIINITASYYKINRSPFEVHMAFQKLQEARMWLVDYKNNKKE